METGLYSHIKRKEAGVVQNSLEIREADSDLGL